MKYSELHALVSKASAGDESAFEALCREKMSSILYRANQIVGNPHDAEDVAQEIVLKMYQSIKGLRDPGLFNAWLQSIITNECNTMLRKKSKKNGALPVAEFDEISEMETRTEFLPREFVENSEKRQALLEVVRTLPTKSRNVLVMYYYENMTTAEIAQATGTSISTVCNNLAKARKAITKKLENEYGSMRAVGSAMAAVPVLTYAMKLDAQTLFPQQVVNRAVTRSLLGKEAFKMAVEAGHLKSVRPRTAGLAQKVVAVAMSLAIVTGGMVAAFRFYGEPANDPYAVSSPVGETGEGPQLSTGAPTDEEWLHDVGGMVEFKDHAGQAIPDAGFAPEGFEVNLTDDEGKIVASAATAADGSFMFGQLELDPNRAYRLSVSSSELYLVTQTFDQDGGGMLFLPREEEAPQDLRVYVSLAQAPFGDIKVRGGSCDCGHVNPTALEYVPDLAKVESVTWEITPAGSDSALYSGTGALVETELAQMRVSGQTGEYVIRFYVEDVFGNSEEVQYSFVIDPLAGPGEYS